MAFMFGIAQCCCQGPCVCCHAADTEADLLVDFGTGGSVSTGCSGTTTISGEYALTYEDPGESNYCISRYGPVSVGTSGSNTCWLGISYKLGELSGYCTHHVYFSLATKATADGAPTWLGTTGYLTGSSPNQFYYVKQYLFGTNPACGVEITLDYEAGSIPSGFPDTITVTPP